MLPNKSQTHEEPKEKWQTPIMEIFKCRRIEFGQGQCLDDPEVNFGTS